MAASICGSSLLVISRSTLIGTTVFSHTRLMTADSSRILLNSMVNVSMDVNLRDTSIEIDDRRLVANFIELNGERLDGRVPQVHGRRLESDDIVFLVVLSARSEEHT